MSSSVHTTLVVFAQCTTPITISFGKVDLTNFHKKALVVVASNVHFAMSLPYALIVAL